ncbi:HET-domain-containing protein [Trametes versicolor FP-101664 SS1]|uniref:HET-domain-containing protein n=1 Tax=Trametes versicolor (strain FP-101664) TaxID=717944 RepID=UPI0004622FA9|nr:HET-domain-containing protein [Trametes versicolor FP-101664 SS1]EIW62998.1 HET-domain-containing protein [Trametes versicolor FP-101664 SS1]
MWLLSTDHLELVHFDRFDQVPGGYAILSHVWQASEQSFQEVQELQIAGTPYDDPILSAKIRGCVQAAKTHGLDWLWIDASCIDKKSSAELSEAINSMFSWYAEAQICYAYLQDVPNSCLLNSPGSAFRASRWFTRGWTLQELIAPRCLVFLSSEWTHLGTKASLAPLLSEITGIDIEVLTNRRELQQVSVARRMSWASKRQTTRVEDEAYSLMGLFGITMPTIYGEGGEAFRRLQEQIMKHSSDQTLFAWGQVLPPDLTRTCLSRDIGNAIGTLLAPSPHAFVESVDYRSIPPSRMASATSHSMQVPSGDSFVCVITLIEKCMA